MLLPSGEKLAARCEPGKVETDLRDRLEIGLCSPEGAFLNLVNWIGNVIAPVGAGLALAGGLISYVAGRGVGRYVVTAIGCLAVSGVTRLLEFWIAQGGGGIS